MTVYKIRGVFFDLSSIIFVGLIRNVKEDADRNPDISDHGNYYFMVSLSGGTRVDIFSYASRQDEKNDLARMRASLVRAWMQEKDPELKDDSLTRGDVSEWTAKDWEKLSRIADKVGWPEKFGPRPGEPDCFAPLEVHSAWKGSIDK